jgi:hypothetical protein
MIRGSKEAIGLDHGWLPHSNGGQAHSEKHTAVLLTNLHNASITPNDAQLLALYAVLVVWSMELRLTTYIHSQESVLLHL